MLWKFIKDGAYRCGWKSSDKLHFYRFTEPQNPNYPVMIELFSKDPGYQIHESDMVIAPLHISDEVSSLSAIMLDDDYYGFMMSGRKMPEDRINMKNIGLDMELGTALQILENMYLT